jgi:hypothetical protein
VAVRQPFDELPQRRRDLRADEQHAGILDPGRDVKMVLNRVECVIAHKPWVQSTTRHVRDELVAGMSEPLDYLISTGRRNAV